jgi:trehalose 6-phosphate phosphatase
LGPVELQRLAPLLVDPSTTAVVTDFDGTVAPIVDDPTSARPLDGVTVVLGRLARRFATVAVVSGRSASFLWDQLGHLAGDGPDGAHGVQLIGLYGMEWVGPDGTVHLDGEAASWLPAVEEAADRLGADAPDGVLVELKGPAVAVHWRRAPGAGAWARERAADVVASSGLVAHPGRLSVELRPPLGVDKGTVLRRLSDGCRAMCFLGDDLGDLPAFAELGRLSAIAGLVTVGVAVVDSETPPEVVAAADLAVAGPGGALAVLEVLVGDAPVATN